MNELIRSLTIASHGNWLELDLSNIMSYSPSEWVGLAVITCLIVTLSHRARFYLKMFVFLIGSLILACTLPIPFFVFRPRDYRNALAPAYGCTLLGRMLGVLCEVRGLENINKKRGAVVVLNHQSGIDLVVLAHLWPLIGRATVVAKRELLYLVPFGPASYLWGTLFIDRSNKSGALTAINNEAKAITEKNAKLLFFPEGTRNQSDTLLPFKKGPFMTAIQNQCPIQPIVVSKYTFLDSINKFFGRGRVIINILPEVNTAGLNKDNLITLIDLTRNTMQTEFEKLSLEAMNLNSKKKKSS